jgi:hypothetical protein
MVVHLCCSVDAGYFLKRLKEDYPDEKLIGFFYDPNIHPYGEFKLRSLDTKRICDKLGVEFVEGEYEYESWLNAVKGKEEEPEKGARCDSCFDFSLEKTAKFAQKTGHGKITTSLLMSPMKSREQLKKIGDSVKKKYGVEFVIPDYRKKGGTQRQQEYAREHQLYRQDYCGCIYGLLKQKKNEEIIDELISPFPYQVLPGSVEERIEFYENRIKLEEKGVKYKIVRENFLNYRLLSARVEVEKKVIPSYTLFYSYLKRSARCRIDFETDGVAYANRMQIIFLKLEKINEILSKNYDNIPELYKNPLKIEEELKIREAVTRQKYGLSPLIVLERFEKVRYDVFVEGKIYSDNKEILIKF